MATGKKEILKMVENMPDSASIDDVMEELYFRKKVDHGLEQLDEGEGIPHEDVKGQHAQWLDE